jgi:putative transposase
MKVEISVPEIVNIFKEIQEESGNLFEMIRVEIRKNVGEYLSGLMDMEPTQFLGRQRYEHGQGDVNHPNSSYPRNFTLKWIGQVNVRVPRDREGDFKTKIIPRSKRYEDELHQDLSMIFLTGVSTRTLSMISERLIGRRISPTQVRNTNKELIHAVERWRNRDLSEEPIKYMFLDGVNFDMRIDGSIEKVPVLVAIGVKDLFFLVAGK